MIRSKKPKVVSRLRINIQTTCLHSHRSPGYGDWSASYDNSFQGVEMGGQYDEPVPFEVKEGDKVFVLWAVWSDGDSFGHSADGRKEVLAAFKTFEKAKKAREIFLIEPESKDRYSVTFIDEVGNSCSGYRGWVGYFNSLTGIYIDEAIVGSGGENEFSSRKR